MRMKKFNHPDIVRITEGSRSISLSKKTSDNYLREVTKESRELLKKLEALPKIHREL
ncbi:hypothetical protein VBD025_00840 [Virgibacillus flavescens]|uniref:hypothetical protein n=1 Tax=Virgibacillus flavescens TaxID=1611422 RepID=UPI003D33A630